MSKESFILRDGEELGLQKYLHFCNRNKGNWSQERQIELYGEEKGKHNYQDIKNNVKKTSSLNGYIEKHGEIDGTELWKKRMDKMWNQSSEQRFKDQYGDNYKEMMRKNKDHTSLPYYINKHGLEAGSIKYKEHSDKLGITLDRQIKKYGEVEGAKRFKQWKKETVSAFCSPISQKFCWEIYDKLDENLKKKTHFAKLNTEFLKCSTGYCYCYDFVISSIKLCIEFNGDLFHANPKKYTELDTPNPFMKEQTAKEIWNFDKIKKETLESFGYIVYTVWESDYREKQSFIIDDCLLKIKERSNERII